MSLHIGQLFRTNGHSFSLFHETREGAKNSYEPLNRKSFFFNEIGLGKFSENTLSSPQQWQGNCHSFHESEWDSSGGSLQTRFSGYRTDPKEKA
jgi:hypothetical protein